MNILVMSWRDPKHPLSGGAEQVMHEHMKGWVEAGHEVTLFSSRFKNSKKNEILDGIEIIRYGNQLGTVFIAAFFWYLFVKHEKFDLIVDQFHGIPFFSPLYIRVPKLAVIQEVTREVWFKNELTFPLNWIYAVVGFTLEPLIFFLYKNIFFMTGSNSAKKDLIKMGIKDKNIKVIPHGVIIKKQKKRYKKERIKTVIFLGALAKDKGIEDALKAFSLLEKKDKYQFWIVGKGSPDYVLQLRKMTKNIQDITFFGFVTIERKFELLSRAHILINPSIREGWGLVNIEANACYTPVVAYKSPGLVDSVSNGKSGMLCNKNTPKDLEKTISNIFKDKKLFKKLQKSSRSWSLKFSWKKSKKLSIYLISNL